MQNRAFDDATLDVTITRLIHQGRDREAAELASERLDQSARGGAMDPITQLDAILPLLTKIVASIDADDLDAPTPCTEFNVRQVLEHMVGGATMFAAAFRGTPPPAGLPEDLLTAFPGAMAALTEAIHVPGPLERTISAPFGEVRGDIFARFVALDGLVHAWDLATATSQTYDPPADVVAAVDAFAHGAISDGMRGVTFAPATEPPAGASPLQRLIAFTGRRVPGAD